MSRRGPEGKVQDAVIKYARTKYGVLCRKNEVGKFFVGSGWPDYMVLGNPRILVQAHSCPRVFFIEFKAPGAGPTKLQGHMFQEIRARGFKVHVISSVAAGKMIVDAECA